MAERIRKAPCLKAVLAKHAGGPSLIDTLLKELRCFTGEGWEQEDDVTLVTLQRTELDFLPQHASKCQ